MMENYICSTQEASEILKLSIGTIQKLVDTGQLPAWRTTGGHRRIPTSALVKYIKDTRSIQTHTLQKPLKPKVILLSRLTESEIIESIDSASEARIELIHFDCPTKMQLNLLAHKPVAILIESDILKKMGGDSWKKSLKEHGELSNTQVFAIEDLLACIKAKKSTTKFESTAMQIINSSWLSGFAIGYSAA